MGKIDRWARTAACLEVLHAHHALDVARVLRLLHLDLAALLVVAERAVEERVQRLRRSVLRRRLPLRLAPPHFAVGLVVDLRRLRGVRVPFLMITFQNSDVVLNPKKLPSSIFIKRSRFQRRRGRGHKTSSVAALDS